MEDWLYRCNWALFWGKCTTCRYTYVEMAWVRMLHVDYL